MELVEGVWVDGEGLLCTGAGMAWLASHLGEMILKQILTDSFMNCLTK